MREHGSPADRGSADRYYGREQEPHKQVNGKRVELIDPVEIAEYMNAYFAEEDRKQY